jgi:hypothetical protein
MDIVVIDSSNDDRHVKGGALAYDRYLHPSAVLASNVNMMVEKILNRLGSSEQIQMLDIWGHGHPGSQGMGDSAYSRAPSQLIEIDCSGQLMNRASLIRLRGRFASDGWVRLHGCHVALEHRGRELLRQLAALWQVSVQGGVENQPSEGLNRFVGPTAVARISPGHSPRIVPSRRFTRRD